MGLRTSEERMAILSEIHAAPEADLTEARRLLDAGAGLVPLHHLEKRPIGEDWNQPANFARHIEDGATGYGLPLAYNGLCSIDPDHYAMAKAGMAAWGFDLDAIPAAGIQTRSTRPNSGGRAAFAADDMLRWLPFRVYDDRNQSVTVLELRAKSENLQDCVPGVLYLDKATGALCTQEYASGRTFTDRPELPEDFAKFWRWLSLDDDALREKTAEFVEAIKAAGFMLGDRPPRNLPPLGSGRSDKGELCLPFPAPGLRGPFNRSHPVETILDAHGYSYDPRCQRWARPGATGTPGIRPIPGKDDLWQSDHAGDPLFGTFDAWAAHVILDHAGDVEAAIEAARQKPDQVPEPEAEHEQIATTRPLVPVDLSRTMTATLAPPRYVIEDYLPRRVVTLFGGHGGAGKTTLALAMAAHVAAGERFADLEAAQGRVLFVSLEDEPAIMQWRLRHVIEDCRLDPETVLARLTLLDGTEGYTALIREGDGYNAPPRLTAAYAALQEHAAGHDLVVVDNASDAYDANENTRRAVRAFIRALTQIARANDAAVALLAHIDKAAARGGAQGNSYSGSTAWHNSARSRLALVEDEETGLELLHEKANFGRRREPLLLTRSPNGIPVPRAHGPQPGDGMIETREREGILAAFRAAEEQGTNIPTRLQRGNGCAMKVLSLFAEYPPSLQGGRQGEERAARLIMALQREGVIAPEPYVDEYRHKKNRLVVASATADPGQIEGDAA
ncbi:MAG TPA: hypothetical protein DD491_15950 [Halieaceae bacterium]|nr:hypothetical protein [Halieaceae bacterium]